MGSKTRLSSYCTKRANNGVNLVTSRKINTRLARPIGHDRDKFSNRKQSETNRNDENATCDYLSEYLRMCFRLYEDS